LRRARVYERCKRNHEEGKRGEWLIDWYRLVPILPCTLHGKGAGKRERKREGERERKGGRER